MPLAGVLAIGLFVCGAVHANAQTTPDFTGRWEISQTKSSPGAIGNNAKVSFPSELIVAQKAAELHVEMRFPRSEPLKVAYKLDGSEIRIALPSDVTETARTAWDGSRLTITARRVVSTAFGEFVTDIKETWNRAGNVLTIQKTHSSSGVADTETAVFEEEQP
jgi:hypothetical protein